MKIAFLGIGLMGFPMARRLCEAGHEVHAWNRSRAKAERLLPFGASVHDTPVQAVSGAEIIITMLENGEVVESVLFGQGTVVAAQPGAVVVDMSSIRPEQARDQARRLAERGVGHLDAPVSGGTIGADQGTLAIMAGGETSTFEQVAPVFAALGRATRVGPSGAGQLAKLANQMIVGITIGAVAEALLLCEKGGADPAKVREAITGGFADSRILQVHGQRMVTRNFTPGAHMTVQLKDMRNALATAAGVGLEVPITGLLAQLYADGVAHGLSEIDHAGLFVELARRNGMA